MIGDPLGVTHLTAAVAALVAGGLVALLPKGTRLHRRVGWIYVAAMATVNVTALCIYDLFGGFGPFHVAAMLSGVTVAAGMLPARRRRPRRFWIVSHAYWMVGSYVGLLAAAASETATRVLDLPFGPTVAGASFLVVAVGVAVMRVTVPRALRRFGFGRPGGPRGES